MSVYILHLTDIHAGPGELRDEDLKQRVPESERGRLLDRLTNYVQALKKVPDYVAVTGDFTIAGNQQGFQNVLRWLSERINEGSLPGTDRFLVVPGNHDVTWKIPEGSDWHKRRYHDFFDNIAKAFPHAYIPDCDPDLNPSEPPIEANSTAIIGGLRTEIKFGQVEIAQSFPFLLDLEREILIFAFNSTLACGIYAPQSPSIQTTLNALVSTYEANELLNKQLKDLQAMYLDSTVIDAGLVGQKQIDYFARLMRRIKTAIGDKYTRLTKIALLHHHITHLWRQQLELKSFESVIYAPQLKQVLHEFEFDLVLHGHKHTNHVCLDASMIPVSNKNKLNPLVIVSGGTIGGYPRLSDRQTFKIIELVGDTGPRTAGVVTEVPLLDTAAPETILLEHSLIFPIPIASRLASLHDLSDLKSALDAFLLMTCAPETKDCVDDSVTEQAEIQFPVSYPAIVSNKLRFVFNCILETPEVKSFYYTILATERLDFRQIARVFLMLVGVNGHAERLQRTCRVVLIIGNLENTHFSNVSREGEIESSINELDEYFKPGSERDLLVLRRYTFSQEEIDRLSRETRGLT